MVRIAKVAVGMRLLDLWGFSRTRNQLVDGICVEFFNGTADTVLLPCRHLVLCEVGFRSRSGSAVANGLGVLWAVVWAGGEHGCAVSSLYSGGRSGELLLALNLGRVADDRE